MALAQRLRLAALALAAASPALAQAGGSSTDVLARLKQGAELACTPTLPVFCANLHVSCAGRTSIPTFPFKLRVHLAVAALDVPAEVAWLDLRYRDARAEWDSSSAHLIVRPREGEGYVRLSPDGRYVFRYYLGSEGLMSLGTCS